MSEQSFRVWNDVVQEIRSAESKFPLWPNDPLHAAAIVAEEVGELQKAVLQALYEDGEKDEVRVEAIQVAAMAFRFLLAWGQYSFSKGYQIPNAM